MHSDGQFKQGDLNPYGDPDDVNDQKPTYTYRSHDGNARAFVMLDRGRPSTAHVQTTWADGADWLRDEPTEVQWGHHTTLPDKHGQRAFPISGSKGERPYISGLGSDGASPHVVATLLGLAAKHGLEHWGRIPEADSDLSTKSAPIVKKFVDKGVISAPSGNPELVPTNSMGEYDALSRGWVRDMVNEVDEGDHATLHPTVVRSASNLVRNALRAGSSKPHKQEFEQGRLF